MPAVPPAGVAIVAGVGADLFINIALTILGYVNLASSRVLCSVPLPIHSVFKSPPATPQIGMLTLPRRYFPGHIHAFYIEYVYYTRREELRDGRVPVERAPGVYSEHIQSGGQSYGTIARST